MTVLVAFAVGFLTGRLTWVLLRPWSSRPARRRPNHRGQPIPTAAGLAVAVAVVVVESGRVLATRLTTGSFLLDRTRGLVLVAVVGFALLGFLDDMAGNGEQRGLRGHVRALVGGHLTTGGVKLLGGGALSLAVAARASGAGVAQVIVDAAVVALSANLANLLDRAPGRAGKSVLGAFVVVAAVAGLDGSLVGAAVAVGAGAALLLDDLHERLMLGDTGANALGAAIGLGVVLVSAPSVRLVVAVCLAVANGASELVSFSRVIDAVPPLRALDRLGRRRPARDTATEVR